ncbi:hypothetical protein [Litoribacillus peritrichatus]|uniref:DUF445 family protein n=1 Tax=Litoribacillus peritrichatus TaxID=718191 RepID=A0ABP7M375_9GAMM
MQEVLFNPEIWKYLSIPLIAGLVGWSTNWLAIQLTFYPVEFQGYKKPFFGWQGIVPRSYKKMASICVDTTMSKLGTLSDIIQSLEPKALIDRMIHVFLPQVETMVDDIMRKEKPVLWENLPKVAKNKVYNHIKGELPKRIDSIINDFQKDADQLINLKHMVITELGKDKKLLNRIFLESGNAEFKFIVNSGLYFGLAFGFIQMLIWYFLPAWWILPLFGLLVGYVTNWIALNIVFRPLRPIKIGKFEIQGIFLKRQKEVSRAWCDIVAHELLTVENFTKTLMEGPDSHKTKALVDKHIRTLLDESVALRTLAQVTMGPTGYANLKDNITDIAFEYSKQPFIDKKFNESRATLVADMIRERMEALSPEEFQGVLRPAFQEDEWMLILAGGILGLLAGFGQLVFIFGG